MCVNFMWEGELGREGGGGEGRLEEKRATMKRNPLVSKEEDGLLASTPTLTDGPTAFYFLFLGGGEGGALLSLS